MGGQDVKLPGVPLPHKNMARGVIVLSLDCARCIRVAEGDTTGECCWPWGRVPGPFREWLQLRGKRHTNFKCTEAAEDVISADALEEWKLFDTEKATGKSELHLALPVPGSEEQAETGNCPDVSEWTDTLESREGEPPVGSRGSVALSSEIADSSMTQDGQALQPHSFNERETMNIVQEVHLQHDHRGGAGSSDGPGVAPRSNPGQCVQPVRRCGTAAALATQATDVRLALPITALAVTPSVCIVAAQRPPHQAGNTQSASSAGGAPSLDIQETPPLLVAHATPDLCNGHGPLHMELLVRGSHSAGPESWQSMDEELEEVLQHLRRIEQRLYHIEMHMTQIQAMQYRSEQYLLRLSPPSQ